MPYLKIDIKYGFYKGLYCKTSRVIDIIMVDIKNTTSLRPMVPSCSCIFEFSEYPLETIAKYVRSPCSYALIKRAPTL